MVPHLGHVVRRPWPTLVHVAVSTRASREVCEPRPMVRSAVTRHVDVPREFGRVTVKVVEKPVDPGLDAGARRRCMERNLHSA